MKHIYQITVEINFNGSVLRDNYSIVASNIREAGEKAYAHDQGDSRVIAVVCIDDQVKEK